MKQGIDPESYRIVVFKDISNEDIFITRSCATSKESITV
ncbi:MAG: 50S ribosomal protein L31, partial [Bacteroidales bacterium]|nr:50S ribosomal protein L31 [Bacteroidales bacterium]